MQEVEDNSSTSGFKLEDLSFVELEVLLMAIHGIRRDRHTAFQGRLKHFLKIGALPQVKLGRGRAAIFRPGDVIVMVILLELSSLGLSPEKALALLNIEFENIYQAVNIAADDALISFEDGISGAYENPVIVYFNPQSLSILSDKPQKHGLFWKRSKDMADLIGRETFFGETKRMSLFNLSLVVFETICSIRPSARSAFINGLRDWANSGKLSESGQQNG